MQDDNFQIVAKTHPFESSTLVEKCSIGQTVQQVLEDVADKHSVNPWYCQSIYVEIDGVEVPKSLWANTLIRKNQHVLIQFQVPEGGGSKNPLRTILTILVIAAAAISGPAIAGLAGYSSSAVAAGGMAGFVAAAGSAFVGAVGMLAVNTLIPPTQLSTGGLSGVDAAESSVYAIAGMQNYEPQYRPLPVVLGTVRYAPPFGAKSYTRISGNDQYLHVILLWGHGPLSIGPLSVGDTLLSTYHDYEIATNSGYPTDPKLNLYPADVYEDSSTPAELFYNTPITKTTVAGTEFFSLDIIFARGLTTYNDRGNRTFTSVQIQYRHRLVGGAWSAPVVKTYAAATANPKRVVMPFNVRSAPGTYEVEMTRLTADATRGDVCNESTFAIIRSVKYKDPVTFDIPVAETQLVIKATDQLSGNLNELNAEVTSIALDYDLATDTWISRPTNNPASLYRLVFQGVGAIKQLTDSEIDIESLEEWHTFCVQNSLTYNKVHDTQMSVQSIIDDVCHAGRALYVMVDNNVRSVVIDRERVLGPVQLFTPANSTGFSSSKSFREDLHGYRCQFNNEENGFLEDEIFVYTEGYTETNATLYEALEIAGVTNPAQVQHLAKYHLATRMYRPETFSWETDWEHTVCSRGDLVEVSHRVISEGMANGRILEVGADYIEIDRDVTFQPGVTYGLVVRILSALTGLTQLVHLEPLNDQGTTSRIMVKIFDFVVTEWISSIEKGDVYSFGKQGMETLSLIVTSKTPTAAMTASLTAVQYSWPEIELYLNGYYPAFNSQISKSAYAVVAKPLRPVITSITSDDSMTLIGVDGTVTTRVVVMVSIPSGATSVTSVIAQLSLDNMATWTTSSSRDPLLPIVFDGIIKGDNVVVRVAAVTALGVSSDWTYINHVVVGKLIGPLPPLSLTVKGLQFSNLLVWENNYSRDIKHTEIWCSITENDRVNATLVKEQTGRSWSHTSLDPTLTYYYWLRAVNSSGVSSAFFPLGEAVGVSGQPSGDPDFLLKQLAGSVTEGQLTASLNTKIADASAGVISQQELLNNQWTVKLQEDGTIAGVGLIMYPDWKVGLAIAANDFYYYESEVYKAKTSHTANALNAPTTVSSPDWTLVMGGVKSQFIIQADEFAITTNDGTDTKVPFIVTENKVGINGNLIVDGTVTAASLAADQVVTWSMVSPNYVSGVSGYFIDAATGAVEFNNARVTLNYSSLIGKPTSLAGISTTEATKLAGIAAGATVGATWGTNVEGQPADADILNSALDLSAFATTTIVNQNIADLQAQIDGGFTTWYYGYAPTLTNIPASDWTTDLIRDNHVGDLFYNELTGTVYRYKKDSGVYLWFEMPNTDLSLALANAAKAQDTADNKRRVFVTTPVAPYDKGDLWVNGTIIKVCKAPRTTGYLATEWTFAADKTDYDSVTDIADAQAFAAVATEAIITAANIAAAKQEALDAATTRADILESSISSLNTDLATQEAAIALVDDKVDANEQQRIDDALALAVTKAAEIEAQVTADAIRDGRISTTEQDLLTATDNLTQAYKAYAVEYKEAVLDGVISQAEQNAIDEAQTRIDVAKAEAIRASEILALSTVNLMVNTNFLLPISEGEKQPYGWPQGGGSFSLLNNITHSIVNISNSSYAISGANTLKTVIDLAPEIVVYRDIYSERFLAEEGKVYGASMYTGVHDGQCQLRIQFFNSAGTTLTYADSPTMNNRGEALGGLTTDDFKRLCVYKKAPAGTYEMRLHVRMYSPAVGVESGKAEYYMTMPQLSEWASDQTEPPSYVSGDTFTPNSLNEIQTNTEETKESVDAMESDGTFSVAEKVDWRTKWPGIVANYNGVLNAGDLTNSVDTTALETAFNAVLNCLTLHGALEGTPTATTFSAITPLLSEALANYYTELQEVSTATTNYKVSQAKLEAVTAAALDATATLNTFKNIDKIFTNYDFAIWDAADEAPTSWSGWGQFPSRETVLTNGQTNAIRFVVDNATRAGLTAVSNGIANNEYVTVTLEVMLVSGTLTGSKILVDWEPQTNKRATVELKEYLTDDFNVWQTLSAVVERPANELTGTFYMRTYLMANYQSLNAKDIIFNSLSIKPSTSAEVSAYLAKGYADSLNTALTTDLGVLDTVVSQQAIALATLDGNISTEETSRINAINAEALARATELATQAGTIAAHDGRISTTEQGLIDATTNLTLAYKAYAIEFKEAVLDGVISEAEQDAIDKAQENIDIAKAAAIASAALDATTKADAALISAETVITELNTAIRIDPTITALADEPDVLTSMGALSARIALLDCTASYCIFEEATDIYVNGVAFQKDVAEGTVGTISLNAGDIVEADKPISLVDPRGYVLPATCMASKTLCVPLRVDSSGHMVTLYSFSKATVTISDRLTDTEDIVVDLLANTPTQVTVGDGAVATYYAVTSSSPILVIGFAADLATDFTCAYPISRHMVSPSNRVNSSYIYALDPSTVTSVGNGYYTNTTPFWVGASGDGDGKDADGSIAITSLGDNYAIPHNIYDFEITAVEPCIITVTQLDGTLYTTIDLSLASRTNPLSYSEGDVSGSTDTLLISSGCFFSATAPFALRTNISTDEYIVIGYNSKYRSAYQSTSTTFKQIAALAEAAEGYTNSVASTVTDAYNNLVSITKKALIDNEISAAEDLAISEARDRAEEAVLYAASQQNLISDAGFELDFVDSKPVGFPLSSNSIPITLSSIDSTDPNGLNYGGFTGKMEHGLPSGVSNSYSGVQSDWIQASEGDTIGFSAYTGAVDCSIYLVLWFLDKTGSTIVYKLSDYNYAEKSGGSTLSDFKRIVAFREAPEGTAYVRLAIRKRDTDKGSTESVAYYVKPQLSVWAAGQTEPPVWVASDYAAKAMAISKAHTEAWSEEGATKGATWGGNIGGQPAASVLENSYNTAATVGADPAGSAADAQAAAIAHVDGVIQHAARNVYGGAEDADQYATEHKVSTLIFELFDGTGWPEDYGGVVTHWYSTQRATQICFGPGEGIEHTREVHPNTYPTWSNWKSKEVYSSTDVDALLTINGPAVAGADVTGSSQAFLNEQTTVRGLIDGKIDTWFQDADPSTSWEGTDVSHDGDLWFDTNAAEGANAVFRYNSSANPKWEATDQATVKAMEAAAAAQAAADGKMVVFTTTPTNYKIGDLWDVGGTPRILKRATVARATYLAADWVTIANEITNTSQITDGAGLGSTSTWAGVTGTGKPADNADVTATSNFVNVTYPANNAALQTQIDGKVESWFQSTDPATEWTTSAIKLLHSGDMWWNTSTNKLKRYSGTAWSTELTDQKAVDAYTNAAAAKAAADGKMVVFTTTPTNYKIGDLWDVGGTPRILKRATVARATYLAADWVTIANAITNTSQITDGAGLGSTSTWAGVTGTGKPADNADVTANVLGGTGVNYMLPQYAAFNAATLPEMFYASSKGALSIDTGYISKNSLKLSATAADFYAQLGKYTNTYNIPIPAGLKWIASCYVKCNLANKAGQFSIVGADGLYVGKIFYTGVVAGEWTRVSVVLDLSLKTYVRVGFRFDNDGGAGCDMWFDGFMLEPQIGTNTNPSPYTYSPNFLDTYTGALNADVTDYAAITAYTDAQKLLAETNAYAYADGVISTEESRAIADATAKLAAAKVYIDAQLDLTETTVKAYADGIVDTAESNAITDATAKLAAAKAYTDAQRVLSETTVKAYADGKVTTEEARAIADATAKLATAKTYTEGWAAQGATVGASWGINLAGAPIVYDSSFSSGANYWSAAYTGETVTALSATNYTWWSVVNAGTVGGKVLQIVGTKTIYSKDAIPIDTSRTYKMRYRVKQLINATDVAKQKVYAGLTYLDSAFAKISASWVCANAKLLTTNDWVEYTCTVSSANFPATCTYVRTSFIVNHTGGDGTVQVDCLEFYDITDALAAEAAAAAYTAAQRVLSETTTKAYADGIVDTAEAAAIADAAAKLAVAKAYTESWSTQGADVTSSNTSADTAKVNGTAAATIASNAIAAAAAVTAMETDGKFSIAEKRTWQIQWPGMDANFTSVKTAATTAGISTTALQAARDALYTFLNTTHNVFATSPAISTLVATDMKTKVAAFYTAMSAAIAATSAISAQVAVDAGLETETGGLIVENTDTGDYAHLTAGGLNFYTNDSGTAQLYKSVEKMEPGEASHGDTVLIPGVWKTAPSIIITPTSTQTYNPDLGGVSQILNLKALNLTEYSSRKYSFTVQALLEPNDGTVSAVASSMTASKSMTDTGAALTTTSSIGIVLPGTGATVPVSFNGTINYTVNHDGGGTFRILVEVLLDATVVFSTYIQPYGVQSGGAEPRYTTGSTYVSATVAVSSATSYTAYPKIRLTEQYKATTPWATTTWATMTARVGTQDFWMSSSISTSNLTVSYTTGSLSGIGANGKVAWTAIG